MSLECRPAACQEWPWVVAGGWRLAAAGPQMTPPVPGLVDTTTDTEQLTRFITLQEPRRRIDDRSTTDRQLHRRISRRHPDGPPNTTATSHKPKSHANLPQPTRIPGKTGKDQGYQAFSKKGRERDDAEKRSHRPEFPSSGRRHIHERNSPVPRPPPPPTTLCTSSVPSVVAVFFSCFLVTTQPINSRHTSDLRVGRCQHMQLGWT